MAIQPDTNLYLLKCPLELSNKHQLTFTNKNQQFEYFSNLENVRKVCNNTKSLHKHAVE